MWSNGSIPDPHALLDICWADTFTQIYDELCDLLDVDDIFALLSILFIFDDLRTPSDL